MVISSEAMLEYLLLKTQKVPKPARSRAWRHVVNEAKILIRISFLGFSSKINEHKLSVFLWLTDRTSNTNTRESSAQNWN